jgi:hypothetical protein
MRTRPGCVEPEIYFRIVHVAGDSRHDGQMGAGREQAVEIALGPKGAFENGNIGALARWIKIDHVVHAVPRGRDAPKPPRGPKTHRVVEFLRKAVEWQRQLDSGEVRNRAEIARREGITRARVTQVIGLLELAPEIQERILSLPVTHHRSLVTERALRPVRTITNSRDQLREFQELLI